MKQPPLPLISLTLQGGNAKQLNDMALQVEQYIRQTYTPTSVTRHTEFNPYKITFTFKDLQFNKRLLRKEDG